MKNLSKRAISREFALYFGGVKMDNYGATCPIFNDMMCLGTDECLHDCACEHIYYKVRLDDKVRAKAELELLNVR